MNKIRNVEIQVNDVKGTMKENIKEILTVIPDVETLKNKSDDLNKDAFEYYKVTKKQGVWQFGKPGNGV